MRYINGIDNFIRGKYQGENVRAVGEEEPEYLHYLLDNCSLDADDIELINEVLGISPEGE